MPRQKNRKPLLIGLGAAAAVVALGMTSVDIFGSGDSSFGDGTDAATATSPGGTVRAYMAALSRGDAQAVLALSSDVPADKTFLTDDVLKRQVAEAPISNIQILDQDADAKGATVHVRADFAGKTSDQEISGLIKSDGVWKLPKGVNELNADVSGTMNPKLRSKMTIFAKPLPDSGKAYVFPGPVDVGSSDPNIQFSPAQAGRGAHISSPLDQIWLGTTSLPSTVTVTKAGRQAVRAAVRTLADNCAKTSQLVPPNCPNGADTQGFIDGTAQWTAPQDYTAVQVDYLKQDGTVSVSGPLDFGLTVQTNTGPVSTQSLTFILATADLTQSPPKVILGN
ncbi:MAG: hypothetical protein P4L86_14925 [Mycobacterium sp.]|nr:hypothetical protein [Mycobacterium sp.]